MKFAYREKFQVYSISFTEYDCTKLSIAFDTPGHKTEENASQSTSLDALVTLVDLF